MISEVEKILERELIKTSGELRVASLLKRGYGNTVAGVIAEFDRVANDAEKAQKFVNDGETLDRIGWDALAAARKRKTQFAALLRQVSEITVDDKLTLRARWSRRRRS